MLMFAGSAGAFVTANSIANVPGMNKIKENNPELFNKIKENVQNVTKSKIGGLAPSKQTVDIAEQNMMFQKMLNEKKQVEQMVDAQKREMERMQENQQRIIEQQQNENTALKNKINTGSGTGSGTGTGTGTGTGSGSISGNAIPPKVTQPPKTNINSILDKLKKNLPKNNETSSVTEENSSDRRVLITSTVDSEKRRNIKPSLKGRKSVLNIRR
jgi:hypothetical protein